MGPTSRDRTSHHRRTRDAHVEYLHVEFAEFFNDKLSLMSLAINFFINGGYGDANEVLNLHNPLYQH